MSGASSDRKGWQLLTALSVALLALIVRSGPTVRATSITVNSTADVASDDGQCTLREAIAAANTDTASGGTVGECAAGVGDDTIDLTGISGTIDLTSPLPDLISGLELIGPGEGDLTIWRNTGGGYRIFTVPVTQVGGLSDTAVFAWSTPGLQSITVTAQNVAGEVTSTRSATLDALPVVEFADTTVFAVEDATRVGFEVDRCFFLFGLVCGLLQDISHSCRVFARGNTLGIYHDYEGLFFVGVDIQSASVAWTRPPVADHCFSIHFPD